MTIRPCTDKDVDTLMRVALESYNQHYLYLWYDGGKKYVANSFNPSAFRDQINDPNVALFLIFDEKDVAAGFLKLNIDKGFQQHDDKQSLELERIYIIKSAAGKGVGKKVLDFTDDYARQRNKNYIWLKVMDSSSATEFYKKSGYEIVGEHQLTFPEMKEEYRGMYVMLKTLN
jgi:diamine N-acetyltransferase